MRLLEKIESDMKTALKNGDAPALSTLRMLVAAAKQVQIDKNVKIMEDVDVLRILQRHIKQHKESIAQFESGKREDLVNKELAELKVLEAYMPEQIGEEELSTIVKAAIAECGAKSKSDMGKVMKLVMEKTKGVCDGRRVSQIVLSSLQ